MPHPHDMVSDYLAASKACRPTMSPRCQAVVPSFLEALGHQKVKRKKLEAGGSFYKIRD